MLQLNSLQITGNLAADPETRSFPDGTVVTHFRILHNPRYKDKATQTYIDGEPVGINAEVWGPYGLALSKAVKKGDLLLLKGTLRANNYEKEGRKIQGFQLRVDSWQVAAKKTTTAAPAKARARTGAASSRTPAV